MAHEDPEGRLQRRNRSPELNAVLASLAPAAEGPLAAALDGLLDALLAGAGAGGAGHSRAARSIVAALVAAGAQGAELWALESPVAESRLLYVSDFLITLPYSSSCCSVREEL